MNIVETYESFKDSVHIMIFRAMNLFRDHRKAKPVLIKPKHFTFAQKKILLQNGFELNDFKQYRFIRSEIIHKTNINPEFVMFKLWDVYHNIPMDAPIINNGNGGNFL